MGETEKKRGRGRPKTLDRQRIVDAAMQVYWREGLHALSLNALCRRIEISKPGLYREFGGEDGLMEAVLERYRELVVVPLLGLMAAELPYGAVIDRVVHVADRHHIQTALLLKRK